MDVSHGVARYLELVKLAALIERAKDGQAVDDALADVNEVLLQSTSPDQREAFNTSALDDYLRETETQESRRKQPDRRHRGIARVVHPAPRRRPDAVGLGHRDLPDLPAEVQVRPRLPDPQEPTVNQRFGIVVHQVLERFHTGGGGSLGNLMELFEVRVAARRASPTPTTTSSSTSGP